VWGLPPALGAAPLAPGAIVFAGSWCCCCELRWAQPGWRWVQPCCIKTQKQILQPPGQD
ncbi:hypothetical protein A2U01_0078193, partial [Trifolium medium]|nr:hypothetical protein [Trifolium medium]